MRTDLQAVAHRLPVRAGCALVVACGFLACGDGAGMAPIDLVGVTAAELSSSECGRSDVEIDNPGAQWIDYMSPRRYSNPSCFKGVVVESRLPYRIDFIDVFWEDDVPTEPAACESLWMGAYQFEGKYFVGIHDISIRWSVLDFRSSRGVWTFNTTPHGRCEPPYIRFTVFTSAQDYENRRGTPHRIAASARSEPTSSAPTRRLSIDER